MSLGKVTRNFQITIPADIRKALQIDVGSIVDFVLRKGELVIKPKTMVDKEQSWFWTEEWQKGEREVDEAKKKGDVSTFKNIDDMRKHLEE